MGMLVVLIAMGAVQLLAILFGQGSFAISQAGEDGSYYVQVAQNMALGYGVTLDKIAPTNATHWGWLLLLASVFKLMPLAWITDPVTLFRIAGATYYLTLFAAGCVVYRITPIGALFMVAYLANRGHWYMETHFVLLVLAMAIRWPSPVTGFLLPTARTDMVLLALFSGRWVLASGAIIGFVWVCLANLVADESIISVSAQIKSAGFNDWPTIIRIVGTFSKYYFPVLPIMCLLALFSIDRWFVGALALLAIHILHNSEPEGWYLAPLFITSLLGSSRVLDRMVSQLWDIRRLVGLSGVCQ